MVLGEHLTANLNITLQPLRKLLRKSSQIQCCSAAFLEISPAFDKIVCQTLV